MLKKYVIGFLLLMVVDAEADSLSGKLLHSAGEENKLVPIIDRVDKEAMPPHRDMIEKKFEQQPLSPDTLGRVGLSISGSPSAQNYSLGGSGFNGDLSSGQGYEYGIKASYRSENESKSLFLSYDHLDVSYSTPDTLSPGNINIKKNYLFLGFTSLAFFEKTFGLKLGYGLVDQSATKTTPNSLVSSYNSHGPLLGMCFKRPNMVGSWGVSSDLSFYIPANLNESNGSFGEKNFGYTSFIEASLFRDLTKELQVSVSLRSRIEQQSYSGNSSNGATDAETSSTTYSFPIELRYSL